jgi:hypothetical protein
MLSDYLMCLLSRWHGTSPGSDWRKDLQIWRVAMNVCNKTGKAYSFLVHQHLKGVLHATSRTLFFHLCDRGSLFRPVSLLHLSHFCVLGHSCINANQNHLCETMSSNNVLRSFLSNVIPDPLLCNNGPQ